VQASHISNQTRIYALAPELRNRLNAVYMVTYFLGGALGSAAGSWAWQHGGWPGVCAVGAALGAAGAVTILLARAPAEPE
jgi:predicted MFS family arabinose efflux permease